MVEMNFQIKELVHSRDNLTLRSSKMNTEFEHYLLVVIKEILDKVANGNYVDMLYTIIKELAINAVKANQKRIFFEDNQLDIANTEDYEKGMTLYKSKFSESMVTEYGKKCQIRGIYIQINFRYNQDGLCVEVINNTPVIKVEEVRLREKMRKSMEYNDIAEFYMDNMDNTEGAGLGIALTMILLKNEGVDPNLFRIITRPTETIARLEIPLTEKYVTIRSGEIKDQL